MRGLVRLFVVPAVGLVACGDAGSSRPTVATHTLPSLVAPAAGPDDVMVARVNDRPVWGSCVAAQVKGGAAANAKAALAQCIDLELAAEEAERRGLASDPDVGEALKQALASRLVEHEEAKVRSAADLPPAFVDPIFKKNEWRMHREEYRGSFVARIEVTDPEGSPPDVAARDAIQRAYQSLAGRKDLFPDDVEAAVRAAVRPEQKVGVASPEPATFGASSRLQPYYHEPLFRLGSIGECAPPVRGPYGWDLILYTSRLEPLDRTREEVLAELFPAMRVRWFVQWSGQLGKGYTQPLVSGDDQLRALLGGDE